MLDDPELVTWSAYTARAWPTLVVIDPEGYIVAQMAGEGHARNLEILVERAGRRARRQGHAAPRRRPVRAARADVRHAALPGQGDRAARRAPARRRRRAPLAGRARGRRRDAGAPHRVRRARAGRRRSRRGPVQRAERPVPACPTTSRRRLGYDVARRRHGQPRAARRAARRRRRDHGRRHRRAVHGRRRPTRPARTDSDRASGPPRRDQARPRPWDVAWWPAAGAFVVAMAGNHTLWAFDPRAGSIELLAGTMNEGLLDGPLDEAWFAQTSGLAVGAPTTGSGWPTPRSPRCARRPGAGDDAVGDDTLEVVLSARPTPQRVGTASARPVRLRPSRRRRRRGAAAAPARRRRAARRLDRRRGHLQRRDPPVRAGRRRRPGQVTTLATRPRRAQRARRAAVDGRRRRCSSSSRPRTGSRGCALPRDVAGEILDAGAHRTQRPVTDVAPGAFRLDVVFTPAAGQKYDDRYGPSTRLQVSATPPELLLEGAGDGVDARPRAADQPGRRRRASCTSPRTRRAATPTPRSSTRPATSTRRTGACRSAWSTAPPPTLTLPLHG